MGRQTKSSKPSRNIPEYIKRAVNACDHHRCQNCGVIPPDWRELVWED